MLATTGNVGLHYIWSSAAGLLHPLLLRNRPFIHTTAQRYVHFPSPWTFILLETYAARQSETNSTAATHNNAICLWGGHKETNANNNILNRCDLSLHRPALPSARGRPVWQGLPDRAERFQRWPRWQGRMSRSATPCWHAATEMPHQWDPNFIWISTMLADCTPLWEPTVCLSYQTVTPVFPNVWKAASICPISWILYLDIAWISKCQVVKRQKFPWNWKLQQFNQKGDCMARVP